MAPLTFRNSKIVYYGPRACDNCGVDIVKMGDDWGGTAFTHPSGPVYPNTEWAPHVCDPFEVRNKTGREARPLVIKEWPTATPTKVRELGYVLLAEPLDLKSTAAPLVISANQNYYDTELAAWCGALKRQTNDWPTWHLGD